jgi:NitT/TauT family transport system substrate-binding protein
MAQDTIAALAMKRLQALRLQALLLPALLLAACGSTPAAAPSAGASAPASPSAAAAGPSAAGASSSAAAPKPAASRLQIKSGYTTTSAAQAALWAGKEEGDFDAEGLDVSLTLITSLATMLAALQNGEVPLAFVSGTPIVQAVLQGGDFVIVAGYGDKMTGQIWTIPSITTPEQLKGKALGTTALGSASHVQSLAGLEKLGLSKDQVGFVATGAPPETLAAIQAGQIQGASFTPPESIRARESGLRVLVDVAALDIKTLSSAGITTRKYAREHPDVVEKFVRATLKGSHRLLTDRDFARKVIAQYSKVDDQKALDETIDYYNQLWSRDGVPSLPGIQQILDASAASIPAAKTAKPEQFVDLSFSDKMKSSGLLDQLWPPAKP